MFWISDKETFVTAEEFGHDLEHVEVDLGFVISRSGPDTGKYVKLYCQSKIRQYSTPNRHSLFGQSRKVIFLYSDT